MTGRREEIVEKILSERVKQFNLPGSEWDARNTPNDWIAIAASYLAAVAHRKHTEPTAEDFEDDMTKAAAVIVAALEHVASMKDAGSLC